MENIFEAISEDKIEILKQTQIEKKRTLIRTIRPKRNHTLFEFDLIKKEVRRAEFVIEKQISFESAMRGETTQKKEVNGVEGCIYISSLNESNAWKKFMRLF